MELIFTGLRIFCRSKRSSVNFLYEDIDVNVKLYSPIPWIELFVSVGTEFGCNNMIGTPIDTDFGIVSFLSVKPSSCLINTSGNGLSGRELFNKLMFASSLL